MQVVLKLYVHLEELMFKSERGIVSKVPQCNKYVQYSFVHIYMQY